MYSLAVADEFFKAESKLVKAVQSDNRIVSAAIVTPLSMITSVMLLRNSRNFDEF